MTQYALRCDCGFYCLTPSEREARAYRNWHNNQNHASGQQDHHNVRITAHTMAPLEAWAA